MNPLRVEHLARIDDGLLDELGVASTRFYRGELERIQVAQRGHGTTTYLVARDEVGRPLGLAPVYIARPPWHPTVDPEMLPPAAEGASVCAVGSYGVYANYLTVAASVPGPAAAAVVRVLVERARAEARGSGSGHILFPYLDSTQAAWLRPYRDAAEAVSVRAKAVLPVVWDSFDEYVSWLPSRRRTPVRRERRRFQESGIDLRLRRVADVAEETAPLLAETEKRYGREADPRRIEFHYTLLGMHLGDDFVALVAYLGGRPVACSLLLACGDRWISKAWGCDYAAVGDRSLYFNLVFYEPVIRAIERGVAFLDYGLGGLESKTERGCVLEPLATIRIPSDC